MFSAEVPCVATAVIAFKKPLRSIARYHYKVVELGYSATQALVRVVAET
jgi:hypothetical protein